MKINEVLRTQDDVVIPEILVRIEKIYPQKSGNTPKYGNWTLQNATAKDDTGEIKILLKNCPDISTSFKEGDLVYVKANHSKQHGFTGVKTATDKYGKFLSITKSAKFEHFEPLNAENIPNAEKTEIMPKNEPEQPKTTVKTTDWEAKELRGYRAMLISYAKDLIVADKLSINFISEFVTQNVNIIYDAKKDNLAPPDDSTSQREFEAQAKAEDRGMEMEIEENRLIKEIIDEEIPF